MGGRHKSGRVIELRNNSLTNDARRCARGLIEAVLRNGMRCDGCCTASCGCLLADLATSLGETRLDFVCMGGMSGGGSAVEGGPASLRASSSDVRFEWRDIGLPD